MKKILLAAAIAASLPLTAAAFSGGGSGPDDFHGRRMERLSKELSLTDEQKAAMETLFKEQHEKFKAIHEETRNKLGTILTPEQLAKMDEMKKHRLEKWHWKKGGDMPE